jgi:hypothetical protein
MAYHVTHTSGAMESSPPLTILARLLDELATADAEHGDIAVTHESEWCIMVSRSGYVVLEHLENGGPRHMRNLPREKILELLTRLAHGELATIEEESWSPGYH